MLVIVRRGLSQANVVPAPYFRHVCALGLVFAMCSTIQCRKVLPDVRNSSGVRLTVAEENTQPALRITVPGPSEAERTFEILFPEHVTARKQGGAEVEHLYLFRPGKAGERPLWRRNANSLEYEREINGVHFLARATLEDDGLLIHYEFANHSKDNYQMIYAVTDPRLTGIFHDVRLERTYVHHPEGFALLASETPERLTMPLDRWLPARYLASFTWPVPAKRLEQRDDGITYYNKSRAVDQPLIATFSSDRQWIVVSFTRTTGNVWSNPELTCQHVDPQTALSAGQSAILEEKILIFQESLDQVLQKVRMQRDLLK
ncbi:MAG TPA: hypothetical protein VFR24_09165 [Candidatus Angelobacter sp.]|nr:hypothetical protein [Candidatus Angelobacter sp.]